MVSAFSMWGSRKDTAAFITSALCSTSATINWLSLKGGPPRPSFINGPLMISRDTGQRLLQIIEQPVPEPSTTYRANRSSRKAVRRLRLLLFLSPVELGEFA